VFPETETGKLGASWPRCPRHSLVPTDMAIKEPVVAMDSLLLHMSSRSSCDRCGTQNRAVFWPFGKRVMELLILDKKERVAESQ